MCSFPRALAKVPYLLMASVSQSPPLLFVAYVLQTTKGHSNIKETSFFVHKVFLR